MSALTVEDLVVGYAAEPVLRRISLSIGDGEVVALLGPNGSGKTTLLKTIAGLVEQREGAVTLEGESLRRSRAENRARRGILLVPEGRRLFRALTTIDNLRAGRFTGRDGFTVEQVLELFPRLAERQTTHAGQLSGGEQQMLAIGRALCGGPRVLLVDEPSLGLAPLIVQSVFATFRTLAETGLATLIAEQNVAAATSVADRCLILDAGTIVFEGPCKTEKDVAAVNEAYSSIIEIGSVA